MPTEPAPITVFDVVRRAVELSDPSDRDRRLGGLLESFEDADEPVAGIDDLEERLAAALQDVDYEDDDPALAMAAATILYLAHRRDELNADADHVLRLAARAEWKGHPPQNVVQWLSERGVSV